MHYIDKHIEIKTAHAKENLIIVILTFFCRFMAADFLGEFRHAAENYDENPPRIVGHFHEWMAGIGLIMCRIWKVCIISLQ